MATINRVASTLRFLLLPSQPRPSSFPPPWRPDRVPRHWTVIALVMAAEDLHVIPMKSSDLMDQQDGVIDVATGREQEEEDGNGSDGHNQVGGFAFKNGSIGGVIRSEVSPLRMEGLVE